MAQHKRVAVIGSGISGLGAAFLLARGGHAVTVFESSPTAGGHARTVDIPLPPSASSSTTTSSTTIATTVPIDTGFIVYNTATYPDLVSLFETLRVPQDNSTMSFAASVVLDNTPFEWGSDSLAALFGGGANLYRPALYTMLYDMRRFNTAVHAYVAALDDDPTSPEASQTLDTFLAAGNYSQTFISAYLIPMVSSVWSATFASALHFPARALFRFFVNHGLAQTFARPQWRTPLRRSRDYVAALTADIVAHGAVIRLATPVESVVRGGDGVRISLAGGDDEIAFDEVVFACHAPEALRILGEDATDDERRVLGAFTYARNAAFVHTDERLMPAAKVTWSAWNFISRPDASGEGEGTRPVCVSYWLNKLQNLNRGRSSGSMPNVFVTLNPCLSIDPRKVLDEWSVDHPQFTEASVAAQDEVQELLQGRRGTWFCGAYLRYGFHEDGLMSGLDVAERLSGYKVLRPWRSKSRLAINNNYRKFELPFASPRSFTFAYLTSLFVINLVGSRINAGLSILAKRLIPDDPSVVLSAGGGTLLRFGHATVASSSPGLVSVRSSQLFARVTDAIRHHRDLVPVAVASFITGEIDCPLPSDLTKMLEALVIAQRKGPEVDHGLQGQMHLTETLLHVIVGGFKVADSPLSVTRLPQLTTIVNSVVYPCWWMAADALSSLSPGGSVSSAGSGGGRQSREDEGAGEKRKILELMSELSAKTAKSLRENSAWQAKVVVATLDRVQYVESKAKELQIADQVAVVSADPFLAQMQLDKAHGGSRELFDHIISPAALNSCGGGGHFESLRSFMLCVRGLLSDSDGGAFVELGFTACDGDGDSRKKEQQRVAGDAMFCGDHGFRLWPASVVLDAASFARLHPVSLKEMPAAAAVSRVEEAIENVFSSQACEDMTVKELRKTLGQCCLWQAALKTGVATRAAVVLKKLPETGS